MLHQLEGSIRKSREYVLVHRQSSQQLPTEMRSKARRSRPQMHARTGRDVSCQEQSFRFYRQQPIRPEAKFGVSTSIRQNSSCLDSFRSIPTAILILARIVHRQLDPEMIPGLVPAISSAFSASSPTALCDRASPPEKGLACSEIERRRRARLLLHGI
jgi:hypothetical protein